MSTHERKSASGVKFEILLFVLPAACCVAILTKGSKLSTMGIGVTTGAIFLGIGEFEVLVAGHTFGLFMFAGERKARLLVREGLVGSHFIPGTCGMAGRTIKLDVAVRIITLGGSLNRESGSESDCQTYSKQSNHETVQN